MLIKPQAYWHDDWLEREYGRIFSPRLFVAESDALATDGDFVSYLVCGRPFSTRRIGGDVHTYENICLHRANLIDPPGRGNRSFRCGYHGWKYNAAGRIDHVPLGQLPSADCDLLQTFPTSSRHGLVFMSPGGMPIIDVDTTVLDKLALSVPAPFHRGILTHDANWKLLVENVLEAYHLSFVHQTSFLPLGFSSTSDREEIYTRADSYFRIQGKPHSGGRKPLIPQASSDYVHAFIFPNLFISVTGGLVGFLSHFTPASATRTDLQWQLFEMPLLQAQGAAVRAYVRDNAIAFTQKVLQEDLAILNTSQLGIRYARAGYRLQEREGRIAHFHRTYEELMA